MMISTKKDLGVPLLSSLVIGSVIGAAVFNLPSDSAKSGSGLTLILAWIVISIGVLSLAWCFYNLNIRKPKLHGGMFNYAKHGFGPFVGSLTGWGYCLSSTWLGNVSYLVLIFSSLSYFFPIFGEGNNVYSYIGSSLVLWIINYLVLRGIREAAIMNLLITVTKYTPLVLFCFTMFAYFDTDLFIHNISVKPSDTGDSVLQGIGDMVMVSIWAFMGIEGAVTISNRAKSSKDIRKATIIGVLAVLFTYVSITFLTLGFMEQTEIATLPDPSMAYIMERIMGPIGAHLVIGGVVISILGAFLGWIILCNEVLYVGSVKEKLYPKFISIRNLHGSPKGAILFSLILVQLILSCVFLFKLSYRDVFFLTSAVSIVPYLLSSIYNLKVIYKRVGYDENESIRRDSILGVVAFLYCLFSFYAAGLDTILLAMLLYIPGFFFYTMAKYQYSKEENKSITHTMYNVLTFK